MRYRTHDFRSAKNFHTEARRKRRLKHPILLASVLSVPPCETPPLPLSRIDFFPRSRMIRYADIRSIATGLRPL